MKKILLVSLIAILVVAAAIFGTTLLQRPTSPETKPTSSETQGNLGIIPNEIWGKWRNEKDKGPYSGELVHSTDGSSLLFTDNLGFGHLLGSYKIVGNKIRYYDGASRFLGEGYLTEDKKLVISTQNCDPDLRARGIALYLEGRWEKVKI